MNITLVFIAIAITVMTAWVYQATSLQLRGAAAAISNGALVVFVVGIDVSVMMLMIVIITAAISVIVVRAAQSQRWRALRLAWWQLSMMGTLGVLLPWHVSMTRIPVHGWEEVLAQSLFQSTPVALLLLMAGTVGMAWTCRDLLIHNDGTPDPFDPPKRWQTHGLYQRWRHPMQVAQLCCFVASSAALGTAGGWLSWLLVAVGLLGPMRWWERHSRPA